MGAQKRSPYGFTPLLQAAIPQPPTPPPISRQHRRPRPRTPLRQEEEGAGQEGEAERGEEEGNCRKASAPCHANIWRGCDDGDGTLAPTSRACAAIIICSVNGTCTGLQGAAACSEKS